MGEKSSNQCPKGGQFEPKINNSNGESSWEIIEY